jgi:tetratricopeptide (TPR) repeat protein
MEDETEQISNKEKQVRSQMLFTLSERDRGTLAIIVTSNEWKRKQLYRFLKGHLSEYTFFDLDLTSHSYTSLYKALQELLPEPVRNSNPAQYLISVTGLESSLYTTEDGRIEFSSLVAQLNFERELIFNQPYIILLWVSEGFDHELQRKAPDLMHWMSKRFVFKEEGPDGLEVAETAIAYGPMRKKGKIKERLERVSQLEETWEKLCFYNEDKTRLVRDKINLLILMAREYGEVFEYGKAEEALQKAIALDQKVRLGFASQLYYELGALYYLSNKFENALACFLKSLDQNLQGRSVGRTFHMIGLTNHRMDNWDAALINYSAAFERYEAEGDWGEFGTTYHQLGNLFQSQRKWIQALDNYKKALEWKERYRDQSSLGVTYHEIGKLHELQGKWNEAINYFEIAIGYFKSAGDEYSLGTSIAEIGRVNEAQQNWREAKDKFQEALDWFEKSGNEAAMSFPYYYLGRIYEDNKDYTNALDCYNKGADIELRFNDPDSSSRSAASSLRQKLNESPPNLNTPL